MYPCEGVRQLHSVLNRGGVGEHGGQELGAGLGQHPGSCVKGAGGGGGDLGSFNACMPHTTRYSDPSSWLLHYTIAKGDLVPTNPTTMIIDQGGLEGAGDGPLRCAQCALSVATAPAATQSNAAATIPKGQSVPLKPKSIH